MQRLCARSGIPFLKEIKTFPDGRLLLEHCDKFGFEGVVSKHLASRYSSGQNRNWLKVKCKAWKEAKVNRGEVAE